MKSRKSSGVEVDQTDEGLLADKAELRFLVSTHSTVLKSTPDTFREAAASLDETGLSFTDEIFPFAVEIAFCREVRFPGFCVGKVHRIVVAIGVLIAQTTEGMAEFMHDDRTELRTTGIGEVIGVEDAPPP